MDDERCPTCGHAVRVVGDTTQHYEPTGCAPATDDWDCPECGVSVREGTKGCGLCSERNHHRNAIARALTDEYGWLRTSVRFGAAEAALKVVEVAISTTQQQ